MSNHICPARYERPGGRERGDRIVKCHLPAGHPGEHEEADTEVTWEDDMPTFGVDEVFAEALTVAGLSVEQEIRARALDAAVRAWAPHRGGDPEVYADAIADVAAAFEEYIRDGAAEERSDDTKNSPKITEVG